MTGMYGGAVFVLIYLIFLVFMGLPLMVMEFSVGRAGRKNISGAMRRLEPDGSHWHLYGPVAIFGNYVLVFYYSVVTGWILSYCRDSFAGKILSLKTAEAVSEHFNSMLSSPTEMSFWTFIAIAFSFWVCGLGVRNGVERVTKYMMTALLFIMLILVLRVFFLPGAVEGLKFYLIPNIDAIRTYGIWTIVSAAMSQAFFTLSIGIGSMAIFGSYIDKSRSLTGEAVHIIALDTLVSLLSGMIIFPICFSFGVKPDAGPGLLFETLPNVFNQMPLGQVSSGLFFVFMSFAALSTLIAVFENIISYWVDVHGWSRTRAVVVNLFVVFIMSLPCVLGFNLWKNPFPMRENKTILDAEDFIVSTLILPIGSLIIAIFCTWRKGWGWNNFILEADSGDGLKLSQRLRFYLAYILPVLIIVVLTMGFINFFN